MIDSHSHLNDEKLFLNAKKIIEEAKKNDVKAIIVPGYDFSSNKKTKILIKNYSNIYGAVGIHPNYCNEYNISLEKKLINLLELSKVVAIGEIGLDYYHKKTNKEKQKEIFIRQLELSKIFKKPVIIHSRDSIQDTIDILTKYGKGVKGVMHCFSFSMEIALICIKKLNFYISFAGPITFINSFLSKKIIKNIPLENLIIETDSPYLTPHPYRGKINKPKYLSLILNKIIEIRNESESIIKNKIEKNTKKLFNLKIK